MAFKSCLLLSLSLLSQVVYSDDLTVEEARCIIDGKTIAFVGDSIGRFCYFGLNYWLEEGELPSDEYGGKWGDNDQDYDRPGSRWTECELTSDDASHRQFFQKEFSDYGGARIEYYFVQDCYYGDDECDGENSISWLADEIKDYDGIVYNCGVWNLFSPQMPNAGSDDDCGADWTSDCTSAYESQLSQLESSMFSSGAKVVFRETTCCGGRRGDDGEFGYEADAIEAQTNVVRDYFSGSDVSVSEAFELWDRDGLSDATTDELHPNLENCFIINKRALRALDDGSCTGSSGGGGGGGDEDEDSDEDEDTSEDEDNSEDEDTPEDEDEDSDEAEDDEEEETTKPTYSPTASRTDAPTYSPTRTPETAEPTASPIASPTASPTASPVAAPTPSPLASPTATPVAAPTASPVASPTASPSQKPVASPTYAPTPNTGYGPTTECVDSESWHKNDDTSKDCAWVGSLDDLRRCGVKGENGNFAYQECIATCGTCPTICDEVDSTSWFRAGDTSLTCNWVADFYKNRCIRENEDGVYAFEACPHACRSCEFENCEDDGDWYMSNEPSKDCEWVASASDNRCTKVGIEDVPAFVACPQACRVCPSFGTCADDDGWFKKGEPSKNCEWVSEFTPNRCGVNGEDDTKGYESCRVACTECQASD